MKTFRLFCFIVLLTSVIAASASENTNNALVTGSFGVAWLDNDGIVRLYDGTNVTEPVSDLKVYAIAAADFLEEGADQLAYLDDGRKALRLYSFKTNKSIGPFGHNIRTMATGHCSPDEQFPSLFICTFSNDSFRWTKTITEREGYTEIPGDFIQASGGRFDQRSGLDDFVTVNGEGNVYLYSTKWQAYSKVSEGKNIVATLAGNFTTATGDEIAMFDKSGSVFLYQGRTLEDLGQKATCLAVGRNKTKLDTLYAVDNDGKIVRYDRETKTWKKLLAGNNLTFTNLIVKDEQVLFAVSGGNLYKISGDEAEQLSTVSSKNIVLQKDGKPLARYRYISVPFKPYIDELRTPSGKNILRDAPWDHLHHHALMYAIKVGGCNFWEEVDENYGTQKTLQFRSEADSIESEIDWNTPEPKTLLKETRKIRADRKNDVTLIDWQSTLKAVDETVLGGGSGGHYYGLGMRFVQEMDKGGRFFNSTGKNDGEIVNGDERLTPCRWMAYTVKLEGQPVTVAVFDHPSNPVPMTTFTMGDAGGRFAYMSATMNMHRKPVTLRAGQTFAVKYRVAVWDGEVSPETVEATYREFVQ